MDQKIMELHRIKNYRQYYYLFILNLQKLIQITFSFKRKVKNL